MRTAYKIGLLDDTVNNDLVGQPWVRLSLLRYLTNLSVVLVIFRRSCLAAGEHLTREAGIRDDAAAGTERNTDLWSRAGSLPLARRLLLSLSLSCFELCSSNTQDSGCSIPLPFGSDDRFPLSLSVSLSARSHTSRAGWVSSVPVPNSPRPPSSTACATSCA
jgi:hypothetical protein